ncbi:MAG: hypothetical protein JWO77_229 [Ilumatobacteraceae bacterium]|nr:hypothetical protein [Ilumatobacteraceae bacterium]
MAAALAVGPVDLHHRHITVVEEPGETGPVGPGALDAGELDGPEPLEPAEQLGVALRCGRERLDAQQGAPFVERGGDVDIEVGVDTPVIRAGMFIVIPFVSVRGGTAPIGATDRTAMGL